MNKTCKNHKLLLVTQLVFSTNPKEERTKSYWRVVEAGWC